MKRRAKFMLTLRVEEACLTQLASLSRRLPQTRERRLVIKDCLVKGKPLRRQRRQCIRDFNYLCFAGAVTRNRRVKITLRLNDTRSR